MNRLEFQRLATDRADDALALLQADRYACAYYIAGYSIECALKACIASKTRQGEFPPRDAQKYYAHNLENLLSLAGLRAAFAEECARDAAFQTNWAVVKDWSEETRYQATGEQQARDILDAISDDQHGVLQWLRRNW